MDCEPLKRNFQCFSGITAKDSSTRQVPLSIYCWELHFENKVCFGEVTEYKCPLKCVNKTNFHNSGITKELVTLKKPKRAQQSNVGNCEYRD